MSDDHLEAIVERYCAIVPALRAAWEDERSRGDDCSVHTLFILLTQEFTRCLRGGETERFPRLFAEVEASIESDDEAESNAAATCFLENISNGSPEAYPHILPFVGEGSLSFLLDWESQCGEQTSFVSAAEAMALAVEPLSAACPAFRGHWASHARAVSADDGATTSFGIASSVSEFVRQLLKEDNASLVSSVFPAIERFLTTSTRRLDDAFRSCFLERLAEIPWAELHPVRGLLGPVARDYWDRELCFDVVRVGILRESRFVETRTLTRADEWMVQLRLPVPEAGALVQEVLRFGDRVVVEKSSDYVDEDGYYYTVWTWDEDDPSGDYTLEVSWLRPGATRSSRCAVVPFSLEDTGRS